MALSNVTVVTAKRMVVAYSLKAGRWPMQAVQARTRITVKNILFATDFSQAADAAAPIAIQIARRYGAKVYGVHVNRFDDYTAAAPNAWAAMRSEEHTSELQSQFHLVC